MIRASLLISTYNWPEALDLTFRSLMSQTQLPMEVVIADDGSGPETKKVIDYHRTQLSIPIKHVWHEDIGFRRTVILNRAVRQADGDYIIQTDGDIILEPHFIEDHLREAREGFFIKGGRGMLSQSKAAAILRTKNISIPLFSLGVKPWINVIRFKLASPLFYGDPQSKNSMRGCNMAFWKKDFVAVNGYNNDMTQWGYEDSELGARLINFGIKRKRLKLTAVCYHIYHPFGYRERMDINRLIYEEAVKNKEVIGCANGYEQVALI